MHLSYFNVRLVFYLVAVSFVSCQHLGNDDTRRPGTSGAEVVEASLEQIKRSKIFPDDNEFLRRLAYVESLDGTADFTYRQGYHGGIWQVNEDMFHQTKDTSLTSAYLSIQNKLRIFWNNVIWEDLRKPLYSALAARLYLTLITDPIPLDIDGQAEFWKMHYNTSGTVEYFVSTVRSKPSECSVGRLDIAFVVDGSGSIGNDHFEIAKEFIIDIVESFQIGSEEVRVGMIQYSSSPSVEFRLNTHSEKADLVLNITNVTYQGGGTSTGYAINTMVSDLFADGNGARDKSAVPRIGIVMTDGKSGDSVTAPAEAARAAGISLFAIGIGDGVDDDELTEIADDEDQKFVVNDFSVIDSIESRLEYRACLAPVGIVLGESASNSLTSQTVQNFETQVPPSNTMTFTLNTTRGEATAYLSTRSQTPSASFHDWKLETTPDNPVSQVFINVSDDGTPRQRRQAPEDGLKLYGRIVNTFNVTNTNTSLTNGTSIDDNESNSAAEFTILVEEGDTRIDMDDCASNPCQNGGLCNELVYTFSCNCSSGWSGLLCTNNVDECASGPCQNGGTCDDKVGSFSCSCPPGWSGVMCSAETTTPTDEANETTKQTTAGVSSQGSSGRTLFIIIAVSCVIVLVSSE